MKKLNVVLLAVILMAAFAVPAMAASTGGPVSATADNAKQGYWKCSKMLYFQHTNGKTYSHAYASSIRLWMWSYDDRAESALQGAVDNYNYICFYIVNSSYGWTTLRSYYY